MKVCYTIIEGGVKMNDSAGAVLLGFFGTFFIIWLAIIVFMIIVNWKMFQKAGKPGWAAIIPIYNVIVLFEIIGYKWYYIFLLFSGVIPFVGQIALLLFVISYSIKLAKSFGQGVGFGIGLWLVNPVFVAIIAFNNNINYVGPAVNGDIDFNDLF